MSVIPGVIVDTAQVSSNLAVFPFTVNPWQGPFRYGSDLWIAATNGVGVAVNPYWYKSSDGGLTWADVDTANAPTIHSPITFAYPIGIGGSKWYYSQADNVPVSGEIDISLPIYEFDLATELWNTTPITAMTEPPGAKITVSGNRSCLVCLRQTQPYFVLFYGPNSPNQLAAQVYNGSSWSGPYYATDITPMPPNSNSMTIKAATVDLNNIVHIFVAKASSRELYYLQFDPFGGTFTSATLIYSTSIFVSGITTTVTSIAVFKDDTDEIIYPVRRRQTVGGDTFLGFKIFRGTPTSSPVWTTETVDLTAFFPPATYDIRAPIAFLTSVDEDYSTIYLSFATLNDSTGLEHKLWYIKNDGSGWSDPILVWDVSSNPPQNFPGTWTDPELDGTYGGTRDSDGSLMFTEYGLYTMPRVPGPGTRTICGIITFVDLTLAVALARCRIGNFADSAISPAGCYID